MGMYQLRQARTGDHGGRVPLLREPQARAYLEGSDVHRTEDLRGVRGDGGQSPDPDANSDAGANANPDAGADAGKP